MADERMGEVCRAHVVPRRHDDRARGDHRLDSEHMANYKVPRHVFVVDALPTNATGKVQKFKLPS
ncbi:AMP-binding enzyme [Sphingomonas sp. MMS24-JH45]